MLYKSGVNLFSGSLDFVTKSEEITLYCAYIRTDQLIELNQGRKINRIVVRWEIRDLHQGASDLELFQYCKENQIALYRNTRIHLKCLINEKDEVLLGSANITGRGIGEKSNTYNFELNSVNSDLDFTDTLYLDKIISQSEYVTDDLFQLIKQKVENLEDYSQLKETYIKIQIETGKKGSDYFLMSELPMFMKVESLYDSAKDISSLNILERKCISHDIATYNLDFRESKEQFYSNLKNTFNLHPFIIKLKEEVKMTHRQSLNYGGVVRWISENTTTVPTPISWELKQKEVVNILYKWICFFDSDFVVERPNYSEVLFYKPF